MVNLRIAVGRFARLSLVFCGLLVAVVYGQADQPKTAMAYQVDPAELKKALAEMKSTAPASTYWAQIIAEAHATEAIPDLEKQFARAKDSLDKAKLAQVLVLLGDKNDEYWNYLAESAALVLNSDAPQLIVHDAQGKLTLSPEWIAWAEAHKEPGTMGSRSDGSDIVVEDPVYVTPGSILLLGATGDPRAIPLLRQALFSSNVMVQMGAAMGLAQLQDKDSIPLIIEACTRAPQEMAEAMAGSLAYFDDADAQKAVDTFLRADRAKLLRERKKAGKGPLER